jgi:hypothetical protein
VSVGSTLEEARNQRGVTIEQAAAATRIRLRHLHALEASDFDSLPGPTYVRGYLRSYAAFLDLDPNRLMAGYEAERGAQPARSPIQPLDRMIRSPGRSLSPTMAAALGLGFLVLLFGAYAYRQLDSLRAEAPRPSPAPATSVPLAAPSFAPSFAPTPPAPPPPRLISVIVKTTDDVWLDVTVDGKPGYRTGQVFPRGTELIYIGQKVTITSGKAAATVVTVDGTSIGPMGAGVATREFSAQT